MSQQDKGPSWTLMLILVGVAALAALAIAYRLAEPFFHH